MCLQAVRLRAASKKHPDPFTYALQSSKVVQFAPSFMLCLLQLCGRAGWGAQQGEHISQWKAA